MGWEYDRSVYESTMSTDYNWVCDKSDYPTNAFTTQAVGNAIGTMIFGHLADKYNYTNIIFFQTYKVSLMHYLDKILLQNRTETDFLLHPQHECCLQTWEFLCGLF